MYEPVLRTPQMELFDKRATKVQHRREGKVDKEAGSRGGAVSSDAIVWAPP
jgi:hypothetical protein